MRAILDTSAFLWFNLADPRFSVAAKRFVEDNPGQIAVSAVTAWEITIKYARGRLPLPEPPRQHVVSRMLTQGFRPLDITFEHALQVQALPPIHHDPFDRLLIAQAQIENLPIITSDPHIALYEVEVIW